MSDTTLPARADETKPDKRICGAQLRGKPGRYCQKSPMLGRNRCRLHGGAVPRGIDNPNWRGRGYSRDIPARYLDRLSDALEDPELAGMRQELTLIDARMGELLSRLEEGNSREAWRRIGMLVTQLDAVLTSKEASDPEKLASVATHLSSLQATIASFRKENETWAELYDAVDLRRRVAAGETKREEMLSGTLTAKQGMALVAAITVAINEEVPEPYLSKLKLRLAQLMNRRPGADELDE